MLKGYKYRLYPTDKQKEMFEKHFGTSRLLYNMALEIKKEAYRKKGEDVSAYDLCYQLKELKKECPWMEELDSQALQAAVKKLDRAYKKFFEGGGFPGFKAKGYNDSFQCPNNKREVDFEKGLLHLPKMPNIPIRISRKFEGEIKTVTVSKNNLGEYYASILVDNGKPLPKKPQIESDNTLGIDVGLKDYCVVSNGKRVSNPKYLYESEGRLKCLQRRLSRKKRGSENWKKMRYKVAKQKKKIKRQREDFLHKVSTDLMLGSESQATTLVVENLSSRNLMQNKNLSRSIGDAAWGKFIRFLKYKCDWYGKNLIEIDRFYPSSQICSHCGYRNEELALSDRRWQCPGCGKNHDRDYNAAQNIKREGLRTSGVGSTDGPVESPPLGGAKKQEGKQATVASRTPKVGCSSP